VNFVLDKNFTGIKATAQAGLTTYGDDFNYNASLSAGTRFADDRGHIMVSVERNYNDGIQGVPRDWFRGKGMIINPAYNATTNSSVPQLLIGDSIGLSTATPGGIITSGPLRGTYFGPGGVPTRFNYGSLVSAPFMQGGDWDYATIARGGDLDGRIKRENIFARLSFDITDNVQVFAQGSYSKAKARQNFGYQYNLGNITIQPDNAFIPASIQPQVTAPFSLGTFNQDLGPIPIENSRTAYRWVIGAKGDLDALGSNWSWDIYGQKSLNKIYNSSYLTVTSRFLGAIDSVRDANGTIVCRSTLANPTNGCVPYNVFGTGVNSTAAVNYVKGLSFGRPRLAEHVAAATLRGNPFSTWAGPVSIATGVEYRKEEVSGTNDALSDTRSYFAGNYRSSFGSYDVKEAFLETVVPLAKDSAVGDLDFNGAVRVTDYSTSGTVTTWKAGATYSPVPDITFRATRSRDIRAPNLAELFQVGASNTSTAPDPFRGNVSNTFFTITQGNLDLKPEVADTLSLGVVFKPSFLPGFQASVDYYNIDVSGAIFTVDAQTLILQCFAGNTALCSQISRAAPVAPATVGAISQITVQPINLANQISRGLDFEASYRTSLDGSIGGNLTVRVLATRFLKNYTNNGINQPTDTVGTNSANQGAFLTLPKWRYQANLTWENGPAMISLTGRGFSAGVYNTSYIECSTNCPVSTPANLTINDNHLPGGFYLDGSVSYDVRKDTEVFLSVDNILNKDPEQVAYGTSVGGANLPVNPALWDTLGRMIRVGVRLKL
jgi:iron complex outermembrane receptor protein